MRERRFHFNWRLALGHILVNAAALGLTIWILPGLRIVHENVLLVLLASGVIFGLLNAFIKPLLQFFMFNFLFVTYGLVLVVINMILIWLLGILTPQWFVSGGIVTIILAAILVGLFSTLLENLLGMTPPIIDDDSQSLSISADGVIDSMPELTRLTVQEAAEIVDRVQNPEEDAQ